MTMTTRLSCRRCRISFNDLNERQNHVEFTHRLEIEVAYKNGIKHFY